MSVQISIPQQAPSFPARTAVISAVALMLAASLVPIVLGHTSTRPAAHRAAGAHTGPLAADIRSIDAVTPLPAIRWPSSHHPVGGMLFVRCTNLWSAMPDGSAAHKLFSMPGLSSPTFATTARTIAFAASSQSGPQIWMAGADGSDPHPVATLTNDGTAIHATVAGLTWSQDDENLAFALTSPGVDAFSGGSAIWVLHLSNGVFERAGEGFPVPTWGWRQLYYATTGAHRTDITQRMKNGRFQSAHWSVPSVGELVVGMPQAHWYQIGRDLTVVVSQDDSGVVAARISGTKGLVTPPTGHGIDPLVRPAVASDGSSVIFGTLDDAGQRDLGTFDVARATWSFTDYAWDPVWSPVVPARGSIRKALAIGTATSFISEQMREHPGELLVSGAVPDSVAGIDKGGSIVDAARRKAHAWRVMATVYGLRHGRSSYRSVGLIVDGHQGRLAAEVASVSRPHPLTTLGQATAFLQRELTVPFMPPAGIPASSHLSGQALRVWGSPGGQTTGQLDVMVPTSTGTHKVTFSYGQGGFGCGSDPVATTVAGTRAVTASPRSIKDWDATPEVVWPATPGDTSGPFSVAGNVSRRELFAIAEAMEAERRTA